MSTDTLPSDPKLLMRSIIQRIATGPDLSTDIGDPYAGYTRCLPAAPFLGPLLAELGVHVVSHGLDKVGPKYGVTVRHVLEAAGVPVNLSPTEAAARLSDPALGWAYIDQAQSNPGLHNLVPLRAQMIKRQVLTTVEVLSKPIQGKQKTHFITGYVHKPYPPVYADLAREAGFDTACIVRGVEGGVIPSLRQEGKYVHYHDKGEEIEAKIDPVALGIDQPVRAVPLPGSVATAAGEDEIVAAIDIQATARAAAEAGILALKGDKGPTYDSLVLAGSIILHHVGRAASVAEAAAQIRAVLDSGKAVARVK